MTELGPGFLRRPPAGWWPGRAYPLEHRVSEWHSGSESDGAGGDPLSTSVCLDARWEVHLDGYGPYEFSETGRTAPNWCYRAGFSGKRWYSVRIKGSKGLQRHVGIPVHASPANREDLWIDWDAAYAEHVAAWDLMDRVEREKARRSGGVEQIADRITNPFAGRLRPGEEAAVDEAIAADAAREAAERERMRPQVEAQLTAMGFGPVPDGEAAEWQRRNDEMTRIHGSGRPAPAVVVSREETGRTLNNIPVFLLVLEVHDGPVARRVVLEHVWGPRHAKRYKPGKRIDVRIDPDDPDAIALAS